MLKKKKTLIGIVTSGLLVLSGTALSMNQTISAIIDDRVSFQFNGAEKGLPDGYEVLNYNDRTYVPARFIAEELGADVSWDDSTRTINITKIKDEQTDKEDDVKVPDNENQEQNEQPDGEAPKKLPLSKVTDQGVLVTVKSINAKQQGLTSLVLKVTNTTDIPVSLEQDKMYLEVDGQKYKSNRFVSDWTYIGADDEDDDNNDNSAEAFAYFPGLPRDTESAKLSLEIRDVEGNNPESVTLDFNIKIN